MQLASKSIVVTEFDRRRLENLMELMRERTALDHPRLIALEEELGRAHVLRAADVPSDVVTMNSTVEVLDIDAGAVFRLTLAFPCAVGRGEARPRAGEGGTEDHAEHISVLSPVGMALLGARENDELLVSAASRLRRLRVQRVLYQPEAMGNFAL